MHWLQWTHPDTQENLPISRFLSTSAKSFCHVRQHSHRFWGLGHGHHCCLVDKSYLTLCNLMDWSPPGPSVCGISQSWILEWVAISFSRGLSQQRNQTYISCSAGGFFSTVTWEAYRWASLAVLFQQNRNIYLQFLSSYDMKLAIRRTERIWSNTMIIGCTVTRYVRILTFGEIHFWAYYFGTGNFRTE